MSYLIESANRVSSWGGLGGVKLPEELSQAIALFDHVQYIEVGHQPTVDFTTVTVENAEDQIRDLAMQLALASRPGAGHGPLEEAKKEVVELAARAVVVQAGAAVPSIIEQMTRLFDEHAADYVAAINALPEDITADSLVKAGINAVKAYEVAQREAQYLNRISSWVAQAGSLFFAPKETFPAIRILRPATLMELIRLEEAQQVWSKSEAKRALDPVLVTGAQLGVEFRINTLTECAALKKALESELKNQNALSTFHKSAGSGAVRLA